MQWTDLEELSTGHFAGLIVVLTLIAITIWAVRNRPRKGSTIPI